MQSRLGGGWLPPSGLAARAFAHFAFDIGKVRPRLPHPQEAQGYISKSATSGTFGRFRSFDSLPSLFLSLAANGP